MAALELKFLGDLEVHRDGATIALPPSRKTRALLAWLALNRRPFRREFLCSLLWDISDDPRGSLRWSLSKLRRVVDDSEHERIVADRNAISLDVSNIAIDVSALRSIAAGDLDHCPLATLEGAAASYRGHLLEGMALSNFHEFDAWCVAEREAAAESHIRILRALIQRLSADPRQSLPHACALVSAAPYDEPARATMIRLLVALGRADQAEQQYETGMRMLKEAGVAPTGELFRAWRGAPGARASVRTTPVATKTDPVVKPQPAPDAEPTLFGRDMEIDYIASLLRRSVEQRRAAMVLLVGEPGIGKSRMLEAVATIARGAGAMLLQASAYESESMRPFALWIDALRTLGSGVVDVFDAEGQPNRDSLFSALSELVAERASAQPVALLFDDMQWADESTAAALHYVARTNRAQPFFGILAARPDELHDNSPVQRTVRELLKAGLIEQIELGPLAENAVRELIATHAPPTSTDKLSRACGGNPLLAIELARAESAGDGTHSLRELVQERLARFDIDGGDVLRWAAVLAPRIDATTLARVTGLNWNRIGEVLETAARQSMLHPSGRGFRFSHDLIARGIYAGISPARRRTMHRRVALLLEQDTALDLGIAADLAHHAAQSGDVSLAARAMVSAGRLCLRFFANEDALTLARKGLVWAEQLSAAERVCLTLELREIMLSAAPVADGDAAAQEYAALAAQALDHGALSHARRGYYMASFVRWMQGNWAAAREEILQSERVARGDTDEEHIVGMAEAAKCLALLERDLPHADAMLMEAQALAARRRVSHSSIPLALGLLRFHENHLDEAADLFRESRTLAKSSADRFNEFQALEYSAMLEFERGRYHVAETYCTALIELGEKLREGSEGPFSHALAGLCRYALTDAADSLDAALCPLRNADAKHRLAYILTRAALLDVERQRPDSARNRAGEALRYAEALDRATEIVLAHVALARAHDALGDAAGYAEHTAALATMNTAPVASWARVRAASLPTTVANEVMTAQPRRAGA